MKLAVVGAGWAGLAAAVKAVQAGHEVTVFEATRQLGGRARSLTDAEHSLDNGQHILIGAYHRCLAMMQTVGADPSQLLQRQALRLQFADGRAFALPSGPPAWAFVKGVWQCTDWTTTERLLLLAWAASRAVQRFQTAPERTVAELCVALPPAVRCMLIDPLCVAALNTPAEDASAQVLLRVLKDALLGGPGSADLLLPRAGLDRLFPSPAGRWLRAQGTRLRLGHAVQELQADAQQCWVDGEPFDGAVLATPAAQAARLARVLNPEWADKAESLDYEPIITVVLECPGARLPAVMTALAEGPRAPAQFAFDHGALGWAQGRFAFVVSGAAPWVARGLPATEQAVLEQARSAFAPGTWPSALRVVKTIAEKRATFRCLPGLRRPGVELHRRIAAAGDHVQGPYPATLEGAVRSGEAAVDFLAARL